MVIAIILGVFLLVCALIGLNMGVLRMVYATFCLVASILMAVIFCPQVTSFLAETLNLDDFVSQNVQKIVEEELDDTLNGQEKKVQKKAIESLNIPASWQKKILKYAGKNADFTKLGDGVDSFTECVENIITNNCMKMFTFFLLFVLVTAALRLITTVFHIVDLISKLPILKEANKSTGMILGLIIGVMVIGVVMAFLPSLTQFEWGQQLAEAINSNVFVSFLYRHNLFLWVISML